MLQLRNQEKEGEAGGSWQHTSWGRVGERRVGRQAAARSGRDLLRILNVVNNKKKMHQGGMIRVRFL